MEQQITRRTQVLTNHLLLHGEPTSLSAAPPLSSNSCLNYSPPDLNEPFSYNPTDMRVYLDSHNIPDRDWLFGLITQSRLFNPKQRGQKVFFSPDYNQSMEQQREMTMKRILYLLEKGVFQGWLTERNPDAELRKFALLEVVGIFDHSLAIKLGVHFFLWCVCCSLSLYLSRWCCCFWS